MFLAPHVSVRCPQLVLAALGLPPRPSVDADRVEQTNHLASATHCRGLTPATSSPRRETKFGRFACKAQRGPAAVQTGRLDVDSPRLPGQPWRGQKHSPP